MAATAVHDDMPADRRFGLPADSPGDDDFDDGPEEFHQLGPIGKAATILLGCAAFTHLLSTISDWHTYHVVRDYLGGKPDVEDAQLNTADTIARLTSIPNVAVSVAAAVVFVLWLWRARLNSEVFCRADHRHSHGWVLGSWLCPGPNLLYPKQIVDDVWAASDRTTPPWADDLNRYRRPALINIWWGCWVIAMLLDVVLRRVLMWIDPTVGSLRITAFSGTIALVLTVASAGLATMIIHRINALQTGRPWVAWWEAEEQPALQAVGRRREHSYAGSGAALGETRYLAAAPVYEEPQPAFDEAAFAAAMAAEPQPAIVNAAQLQVVPDPPQPSWSNGSFTETTSRYTEPSPSLVGLPPLPSVPGTPEPPSDKPEWSPFASVVQEWQEEEQVPEPPQGLDPGTSVWPTEQETRVWPSEQDRSASDYLNPAAPIPSAPIPSAPIPSAPIPSPPTPPLTLVPEPGDYSIGYDRYSSAEDSTSYTSEYSEYDRYGSYSDSTQTYDQPSYEPEYQQEYPQEYQQDTSYTEPAAPSAPETGYQPYDRSYEPGYQGYTPQEYSGYQPEPTPEPAYEPQPAPAPEPTPEPTPEPAPARKPGRRFRPGPADQPSAATPSYDSTETSLTRSSYDLTRESSYDSLETTQLSSPPSFDTPSYDSEPRFDRAPTFERPYEPEPAPAPEPPRFEAAPVLSTRPEPTPEPRYETNSTYATYEPSYDDQPANGNGQGYGSTEPSYAPEPQPGPYRTGPYSGPQRSSHSPEPQTGSYGLPPYESESPFGSSPEPEQSSYDPAPQNLPSAPLAPRDTFVDVEPEQPPAEPSSPNQQPRHYPRRRWSV